MTEPALPRDIVLLVDDSPEALGFLTDALEQSGFSVLIATSGSAALNIVERITPDLILLDAVMPSMDGFETCRRLKANAGIAQIPVVFMTGLTETEHVVHALESGGVDYLTKPINVDELRARIRVHLRNARSAQSSRVALDVAGRHLMAVRRDGSVLWSTPQATRLVNAASGTDEGLNSLAAPIADFIVARENAGAVYDTTFAVKIKGEAALQLSFLGTIGTDEYLFRLTATKQVPDNEILRQRFKLTQRESEVLLWIAKGKANKDIGEILGLSARTVNKHLEQIYIKLGVENRSSAAVMAASAFHEN
ncbi:response regulator transcription factor (plasmid) [Rhizobium sp. CB3171]|uniref:response regulator transcription factor n=1 Tax=unclassified Rhizobium TaxID=2613769 RepID=UPI000CDF4736|nr:MULTISPECIES: response regulator transcription factor [Rhizobium]AVA26386.1 response regulator CheY-like domain-containing protein [Rhizobium sp. NXC24]UWU24038.1 response regulator transcription factor [Rhizobium tropici]WFU04960.1 response regulator transcription factor [Rhizobium sp. CB3171]